MNISYFTLSQSKALYEMKASFLWHKFVSLNLTLSSHLFHKKQRNILLEDILKQ